MRSLLLMLLPLFLSACLPLPPGCARLPEGVSYCLQPTSDAPAFAARQRVIAQFEGKRERVILELDNAATGSQLVALSSFGHELLLASWDNKQATAQRLPHPQLTAERAMALMQLVYWPVAAVQKGLDVETRVEETRESAAITRRLLRDGQVLLEIRRDDSAAPYQQLQLDLPGYDVRLDITTLPVETAPGATALP